MKQLEEANKVIDGLITEFDKRKDDVLPILKAGGIVLAVYVAYRIWRHYNAKV